MRPSLLLDFANTRRLDPRIAFTRASTATYFDRFGVLKTAAVNEPRFDFDPVTGYCKGLLIEEARANLLTYSQQFDNAAWSKSSSSITAEAAVAPDGTATADKLVPNNGAQGYVYAGGVTITSGVSYTFSCYVKAAGFNYVQLNGDSVSGRIAASAYFDLLNGVVVNVGLGSASIVAVGGGWFRCSVSGLSSATAAQPFVRQSANGTSAGAGDGASGLYVWGAQLEAGTFATSYIPTTSAAVTRSAESVYVTGANFSSWYGYDEGTLFVAASTARNLDTATNLSLASINNGTVSVRIQPRVYSDRVTGVAVGTVNGTAGNDVYGAFSAGMTIKAAVSYSPAGCGLAVNGVANSGAIGISGVTANQLALGWGPGDSSSGVALCVARVAYYPRRLSNADLQELTR